MNKWSKRRKFFIRAIIFLAFIILVAIPAYLLFYRAPSCFDSKQNSDETGIDCGGSCQLLCTTETLPLIIKGDPQVLKVRNSFQVVALIENPNANAEIYRAKYFIRLYSTKSIAPLKIIEGETFVPKGTTFAIIEGLFASINGEIPIKATLEWQIPSIVWKKNNSPLPKLAVSNKVVTKEGSTPQLDAVIENTSLQVVSNVDIAALVYDDDGNIVAASKTFVEIIQAGSQVPIVFSWPEPFSGKVLNIAVISRMLPDKSFIK